ncbi:MAG: diguanylate cyclase [Azoarcus sp.]|jgi:diguanylate cyclase|nr:diguanylate cyclase [Azoarcus sp.]
MTLSQSRKPRQASKPVTDSKQPKVDVNSPSELARETLRQLAQRKVPPTPDNYRELYFQICGAVDDEVFPIRTLKAIASALPRVTPADLRNAQAFEAAVASGQWSALRQAIVDLHGAQAAEYKPWDTLIRDFITQFERRHGELTQARKREALIHILDAHPKAGVLYERLSALVRSWSQSHPNDDAAQPSGTGKSANVTEPDSARQDTHAAPPTSIPDSPLRPLLAKLLTNGVVPLADDDEFLTAEARALSETLLGVETEATQDTLTARLERLITRMEWIGEEHHAVREALLNLLHLIVDNIRELVIDDSWLRGQLSVISETFSGPISLRMLDAVSQQLREVIDKQSSLKRELAEAQSRLKEMLASFIDNLSEVSVYTNEYHILLGRSAQRISEATNIADLSTVVGELLVETRHTQESTLRAGQELTGLREQVEKANQEIARLQHELDAASQLMRHDQLTGVLNRKGLADAFTREVARARRKDSSLCIALIDIDNFKKLNDGYGHDIGDEALCHLTQTVTETLRPQDVVARYGGEEFIILLPDTPVDAANTILVRLQRELTRRIFCAPNSERLLITFSAGIALLGADETPEAAITRADSAMYAAKRAGKNRVLTAA